MKGKTLSELLCFYVAYHTPTGLSWRITETPLDLDKAQDLKQWIEEEEDRRGLDIAPVFWKRLGIKPDSRAGRARLEIKRSLAPANLWHWAVIFETGHVFVMSGESFESAELCMADAAGAGLDALHGAEAALAHNATELTRDA